MAKNQPIGATNIRKGNMFGISISSTADWLNLGYIVSIALSVVFSLALWRVSDAAQKESKDKLDKYKSTASIQIAKANATAEVAKAKAAEANEENKRLTLQIEQEKLRVLELQNKLSWRKLTDNQIKLLKMRLSGRKFNVHIIWINSDSESTYYANIFRSLFIDCGWNVTTEALIISPIIVNLVIDETDSTSGTILSDALKEAGVGFYPEKLPSNLGAFYGSAPKPGDIVVAVGVRPPPNISFSPSDETGPHHP